MTQVPEGIETTVGEGVDLRSAIVAVAEALSVEENMVHYKLDLAHFRSESGTSKPVRSVKIIGWAGEEPRKDYSPKPDPSSESDGDRRQSRDRDDRRGGRDRDDRRGGRDRDDRRGKNRDDRRGGRDRDDRRGKNRDDRGGRDRDDRGGRGLKGPEEGTTEASDFAQEWLGKLMEYMEIDGEVVATGSDERVHLRVSAKERAGRLIGRRGATLASIRQILALALEKHGELTIDVDVEDNRSDGGERKQRDDRGGRDRDDRKDDRGPRYSDDKLQALAKRAAEKAVETERAVTINLDLNSYGRRVVHLAIAEIEGVSSASEERDGRKVVQVIPD